MATELTTGRGNKSEERNPKPETNPNFPNSNFSSSFAVFELLNFEFVLDFAIGISDFWVAKTCLALAMPG